MKTKFNQARKKERETEKDREREVSWCFTPSHKEREKTQVKWRVHYGQKQLIQKYSFTQLQC